MKRHVPGQSDYHPFNYLFSEREERMLGNYPIDVVLLATDLDSAKDFYTNKVGLRVVNDSQDAVTFKCGGDSNLAITKSTVYKVSMSPK